MTWLKKKLEEGATHLSFSITFRVLGVDAVLTVICDLAIHKLQKWFGAPNLPPHFDIVLGVLIFCAILLGIVLMFLVTRLTPKPQPNKQLAESSQTQLALLSALQVEALELRRDLQEFLKSQPIIDRSAFDGPSLESTAKWLTACHQRDRKVRANYELKFKDRANKVFNLFVVDDIRDDHLASLAWNAKSVEDIQDLIDTLWKVAGRVKP